jgi:predicted  nucleic acid-binding Zn-ribbon protein
MNISSTSSTSSAIAASGNNGTSTAQIQKQIAALQQQIIKEQASKDDAKTKVETVAAYQEEIAALEMQLQQIQQRALQDQTKTQNSAGNLGGAQAANSPKTRQEQIDEKLNQSAPFDSTGRIVNTTA